MARYPKASIKKRTLYCWQITKNRNEEIAKGDAI